METSEKKVFKPYISATDSVAEFTVKSVLIGALFGIIATVIYVPHSLVIFMEKISKLPLLF